MKKIYLSIFGLSAFGSLCAQNLIPAVKPSAHQIIANPHKKSTNTASAQKTMSGPGHIVRSVFPENIVTLNGYTQGAEYNVYANSIFIDSTVVTSSSTGTASVFNMKAGATFDPKSIHWNGLGTPLLSPTDAYTVDSLWLGLSYSKVNYAVNDTIIVEIAWGLPSNATVYQALSINSVTPSLAFRTPKIGFSTLHGDNSAYSAAPTNKARIKRLLTTADTLKTANGGYIIIPNVNQLVPAGNIFSASYTFKPGTVVPAGSVVHKYTGGTAQTTNGIIGFLYSDPSSTSNYYFHDVNSFSGCYDYYSKQRYGLYTGGTSFLNSCGYPNTEASWDIGFSVSYLSSSVGVNDLEKNGFALGQNTPNPFTNGSAISYQLVKDAKSVLFTVTDVMGRVISNETAS
ncbi:MAG: hypothetical protein H7141_14725, partial [Burkholderiales bacterium]|nr:hypothetical protein [Bacteroidia bacterium]